MKSSRNTFVSLGSAALLAAVISLLPQPADACGDKNSPCACGAACPSKQMAEGQAPGACACAGAAAAAADAKTADDAASGCAHGQMAGMAAGQRAALDPATGQLTVPAEGSAPEGEIPPASSRSASPGVQVAQPGGGVMAAVPADRAAKAVATIDPAGNTHAACAE